jgi:hypothetical protein
MTTKTSIYYDIISQFDNKGQKQAEKGFAKLQKSALDLAKSYGIAFTGTAILGFGAKAISMAAKEDQQFKVLGNTLKNLGLGFAADSSEKFITSMYLATGTAKSELIPAYQALLTATGDVALSQKDLQLAMDVSKGTGKDLTTVTTALSKGYLGNTTSLSRLGAGLDKALLKTGRMDLITKQLSSTFKGAASTAANTFEGKLQRVKAAAEESMVILGKGLISSLQTLAGDNSLQSVTNYMMNLATETSYAIQGITDLISIIKSIPGVSGLSNVLGKDPLLGIPVVGSYLSYLASRGKKSALAKMDQISPTVQAGIDQGNEQAQRQVLLRKQQQLALEKSILASQKAQTQQQKQQALLKILGSPSQDFEMMNLQAALQRNISDTAKASLEYQLLFLQAQNQTGAALDATTAKLIAIKEAALAANDQVLLVDGSIVKLSTAKDPFAGFPDYVKQAIFGMQTYQEALRKILDENIAKINAQIALLAAMVGLKTPATPSSGFVLNPTDWSQYVSPINNQSDMFAYQYQSDPFGVAGQQTINITLDPGLIATTTQASTANGTALTINRTNNNFGTTGSGY